LSLAFPPPTFSISLTASKIVLTMTPTILFATPPNVASEIAGATIIVLRFASQAFLFGLLLIVTLTRSPLILVSTLFIIAATLFVCLPPSFGVARIKTTAIFFPAPLVPLPPSLFLLLLVGLAPLQLSRLAFSVTSLLVRLPSLLFLGLPVRVAAIFPLPTLLFLGLLLRIASLFLGLSPLLLLRLPISIAALIFVLPFLRPSLFVLLPSLSLALVLVLPLLPLFMTPQLAIRTWILLLGTSRSSHGDEGQEHDSQTLCITFHLSSSLRERFPRKLEERFQGKRNHRGEVQTPFQRT